MYVPGRTTSFADRSGQRWPHRRAVVAAAMWPGALLWAGLTAGQPVVAQAAGISAIGNEAPLTFAVSPLYARTHMLAAVSGPLGQCSRDCLHLWVSRDGGASWHRGGSGSPPGAQLAIVPGARGGERIAVATQDGVMASDDDGGSWVRLGGQGVPSGAPWLGAGAIAVAGRGADDYVVAADGDHPVAGSHDAATDLAFSATGAADVPALLAARDTSSGLPEVMQCDGTLACSGAALLPGASPQGSGDITVLAAVDFTSSQVVYARTTRAIYASVDGGRTFLSVTLPPAPGATYTTIPAIAVDPHDSRTLYAALLEVVGTARSQLTAGGVYVSHDRGTTWRALSSPGPVDGGATSVAVAPDGRVFAGYVNAHGDAGLVCSDGEQWRATCGTAAVSMCTSAACTSQAAVPPSAAPATPRPTVTGADDGTSTTTSTTTGRSPLRRVLADGRMAPRLQPGWMLPLAGILLAGAAVALVSRRRRAPR